MVEALLTGQYMAQASLNTALDNLDVVRQLRAALQGGREPAAPYANDIIGAIKDLDYDEAQAANAKPEPQPRARPVPQIDRAGHLVELLTSGEPMNLRDASYAAGYTRSISLETFLRSPYVVLRFKQALADGRTLPPLHAAKILSAIAALGDEASDA
jgi:hypothetical protein